MESARSAAVVVACAIVFVVLCSQQSPRARSSGNASQGVLAIVEGEARVIDGDTLVVAGQHIRLEGIDAPEMSQRCSKSGEGSTTWPAGRIAAAALQRWVQGSYVRCRAVGRGRYGRLLGRCEAGGRDLNIAMIRHGLAWAFLKYSRAYVADERHARAARMGIWSADCQPAWDFRANRWRDVADRAPRGCAIKGNVTRKGRIYHMPWGQWYGRTRIDTSRGERWFCDEAEAVRAGWRPARL